MVPNKTKNLFNQAARRAALAFADSELCGKLNSLDARARAEAEEWAERNPEARRLLSARGSR